MDQLQPENDYKKRQEAIERTIKSAAKQDKTEILKSKAQQIEKDPQKEKLCEMSTMLFHEGLAQYKKGDLTFEEFTNDLQRSLAAINKATKEKE